MQLRPTIALFILTTVLLAGCTLGFKSWPKPEQSKDTFGWHSVALQLAGNSMIIEGRLDGKYDNFKDVRVLIEPLGPDSCSECPFKPSISKEFRSGDAGFQLVGPWMKIQVNGIDTTIPYRVRLVATNRMQGLDKVPSTIERIDP